VNWDLWQMQPLSRHNPWTVKPPWDDYGALDARYRQTDTVRHAEILISYCNQSDLMATATQLNFTYLLTNITSSNRWFLAPLRGESKSINASCSSYWTRLYGSGDFKEVEYGSAKTEVHLIRRHTLTVKCNHRRAAVNDGRCRFGTLRSSTWRLCLIVKVDR